MKLYYTSKYTDDPTEFVVITHGMAGYRDSPITTQEGADVLNDMQGITPAQVQAATSCSMNDCWDRFDDLVRQAEGLLMAVDGEIKPCES